jgi:hypothetical protein
MAPLLDDSGVLISLNQLNLTPEQSQTQLVSWLDGQEQLLLEMDASLVLMNTQTQRQFDPSGQYFVVFESFNDGTGNNFQVNPYAVDLSACFNGDCALQNFNGFPYWSPNLSWLLIQNANTQNDLILRNARTDEEITLGSGFSPYWIDAQSFIYARANDDLESSPNGAPSVEILAAAVGDPLNPTILLESADIAAAITGDDPTMPVSVQSVIAHPDQPNWLFIAAAIHPEIESQNNYILAFQRDTAEITVALDMTDNSLGSPLQIILDGQYLAFSSFGAAPISSILAPFIGLIPLEPADMTIGSPIESYRLNSGFNHDWSQDGRWLLLVEQNALRLIAPGHNYDQTIAHNLDFCYEAAWINPSPE